MELQLLEVAHQELQAMVMAALTLLRAKHLQLMEVLVHKVLEHQEEGIILAQELEEAQAEAAEVNADNFYATKHKSLFIRNFMPFWV